MLMEFVVRDCGFTQILSESILYMKCSGDIPVFVAIDVDIVIIAHKLDGMCQLFRSKLTNRFKFKDLR